MGLHVAAVLEVRVDDSPLERVHGVELDRSAEGHRVLRSALRRALERGLAPLAVAGDIDDHTSALALQPAKGDPGRDLLERVDGGSVLTDDRSRVALALDAQ